MASWSKPVIKVFGILFGTTSIIGVSFVIYQIKNIQSRLQIPDLVTNSEKKNSYIYIRNHQFWIEEQQNAIYSAMSSSAERWKSQYKKLKSPHKRLEYMSIWEVLRELSVSDDNLKKETIDKIAEYHRWHDFEYKLLSERLDRQTLVTLARMKNVDQRLFRAPPKVHLSDEEDIEDELRELLVKLPQEDVDDICLNYFTQGALEISEERQWKRGGLWCFAGHGINYTREVVSQEKVESFCLQALVKHSKLAHHCEVMLANGILPLLQKIAKLRPDHLKIQRNIIRIVANISAYDQFHEAVINSGWVTILAGLMNDEQLAMRLQSTRALVNLDEDNAVETYEDGVYLLHPRHQMRVNSNVDIVFLHGLMGGVLHSWRQQEVHSNATTRDYTTCWPEKWLPRDIPNARILCVEYDTQLSEWLAPCPHNQHRQTIAYRSQEILDKLKAADVGKDRPIIWVTHSMGGLIVKELLKVANQSDDYKNFSSKTRGVLFYSTPHFGSDLAKYSLKTRKILFPSVEVMELSNDSNQLHALNDDFINLAQKYDYKVLSFGENAKTDIGFGIQRLIVHPECSNPGIGTHTLMDVNHLNICKPPTSESDIYVQTVKFCRDCTLHHTAKDVLSAVPNELQDETYAIFS